MTKQIAGGEYFQADDLEIIISADGSKVWINIDGFLAFRAYRVSRLSLRDDRTPGTRADDGNATAIAEPSGEGVSRSPSPLLTAEDIEIVKLLIKDHGFDYCMVTPYDKYEALAAKLGVER